MTRRIGVGVVGTGFVGRIHTRSARLAGGRLVGVAGSSPERAREAAGELGEGRGYESAEDLIADPAVEVVHLCTPNYLHDRGSP